MRYFIELSYLGTNFHGWQRQNNAKTVQQELEEALSKILAMEISVIGCGRTDAGVHASQFFAHIDSDPVLQDPKKLMYGLNGVLSKDIAVHKIHQVPEDSHARFDATSRAYEYHLNSKKDPFRQQLSWDFRQQLDVSRMNEAASKLLEVEEFGAFCKIGSDNKTMRCNVTNAQWEHSNGNLVFHITADRFLRNMVRAIVGTLVDVGLKKINLEEFQEIVKSQNRNNAGISAPAHGLYLTRITYPYIDEQ